MSDTKEKKPGFFSRLFSGRKDGKEEAKSAGAAPALKHSSMGTGATSEASGAAAMADISRKSALVKHSMNSTKSGKSTDLMGELADDFMRLKDEKPAEPKPAAKKDVWD